MDIYENNKLICYIGSKPCGCVTQFFSTRDRKEASKAIAQMIKDGLSVKETTLKEGDEAVGLCPEHKAAMAARDFV
jgi:hypothetical protein